MIIKNYYKITFKIIILSSISLQGDPMQTLTVATTSFAPSDPISTKYGYAHENISPQISWSKGPDGTKSYAIICHDPDAKPTAWTHWIVFNIPATISNIAENVANNTTLSNGAQHGTNDYQEIGWGGPKPPSGTHHYIFTVYALDSSLPELKSKTPTKDQLLQAMNNHKILAQGTLMGTYKAEK